MGLDIHAIILQLVKNEDRVSQEADLSKLRPIDSVYQGHGLWYGNREIEFNPDPDYEIDGYTLKVNLDDDIDRLEKFERSNADIRKYNDWDRK